jgi:hypothetical protein
MQVEDVQTQLTVMVGNSPSPIHEPAHGHSLPYATATHKHPSDQGEPSPEVKIEILKVLLSPRHTQWRLH